SRKPRILGGSHSANAGSTHYGQARILSQMRRSKRCSINEGFLRVSRITTGNWSCPCRLRINLPGSPVDRHRSTKASTSELSWLPRGPLSPGDALEAGCPDTCHLLRSPPCAVSYQGLQALLAENLLCALEPP